MTETQKSHEEMVNRRKKLLERGLSDYASKEEIDRVNAPQRKKKERQKDNE
jgi:hypothetical protein